MMDAERAQECKTSLMWAEIVEEVERKIHYESQKLRTCKPEELLLVQAKILAYESIKNLPNDVIDRLN